MGAELGEIPAAERGYDGPVLARVWRGCLRGVAGLFCGGRADLVLRGWTGLWSVKGRLAAFVVFAGDVAAFGAQAVEQSAGGCGEGERDQDDGDDHD